MRSGIVRDPPCLSSETGTHPRKCPLTIVDVACDRCEHRCQPTTTRLSSKTWMMVSLTAYQWLQVRRTGQTRYTSSDNQEARRNWITLLRVLTRSSDLRRVLSVNPKHEESSLIHELSHPNTNHRALRTFREVSIPVQPISDTQHTHQTEMTTILMRRVYIVAAYVEAILGAVTHERVTVVLVIEVPVWSDLLNRRLGHGVLILRRG